MAAATDRRRVFRQLHEAGCFVIPNPWDLGSARVLVQLGFKALATTSSGFAWTLGRADNNVPLAGVLAHLKVIANGVDVPVNADFEGGFAVEPEGVAVNVAAAVTTGVSGLSIEDSTGEAAAPLFDFELAVARIRAARQAIDASGVDVLLTARSEGFIVGRPDLPETIRRLTAFAEAGADCLYAPGILYARRRQDDRSRGFAEADQRARLHGLRDRTGACRRGRAPHQRRRRARAIGLGRVSRSRKRDRRARYVFRARARGAGDGIERTIQPGLNPLAAAGGPITAAYLQTVDVPARLPISREAS